MATSLSEIAHFLEAEGIKFSQKGDEFIHMGWNTDRYQDPDGRHDVMVVITTPENGEYVKVFVPKAFAEVNTYTHRWAFFKACMMIQWETKLIQFEYDDSDGEVRPIVEFPLEDARLTQKQLMRCIKGIVHLIDNYYPMLHKALNEGVVEMPESGSAARDSLAQLLSGLPDELIADALREAERRKRES